MRSPSPADLGYRALGLLPVAAAAAAEGAWVTVVYAAIASFRREAPAIGLWMFIVAAMAGIATARSIRGRASGPARLAVVVLFGLLGSLSDPTTADLLGRGALGVASGGTVGGLLSALAAWRGTRHRDARNDDEVTGSLLAWAVPGLALPWLIGASTDLRPVFVALALPATLLFVAACLVAVGVTRLDTLGRSVGLDWRTNRTWLALLVGVVGSIVVIGTPIAFLLGSSVSAIIAGLNAFRTSGRFNDTVATTPSMWTSIVSAMLSLANERSAGSMISLCSSSKECRAARNQSTPHIKNPRFDGKKASDKYSQGRIVIPGRHPYTCRQQTTQREKECNGVSTC